MKKILLKLAALLVSLGGACAGDFEEHFEGKHWVREYYNEVIQKKDRNVFFDYVPRFKERPFDFYEHLGYELYWYEELNRLGDVCKDFYFEPNDEYCLFLLRCSFAIEKVVKLKDCYYQFITRDIKINSAFIEDRMYEGCDWSLLKDKSEIQLYLEFDGEYLFIYADEAKTLLATYCMYEEDEYGSFLDAVATNNFDNMEFTFPRHADGTCDNDEGTWEAARKPDTGISLRTGKAITVKENLRVYSFDSATSPVLITLVAETPVEILGVGGEETIDGITSKWVHVRLMPGTTGTDGVHIEWGNVVGWCFGGVESDLEEAGAANAHMSKNAEPAKEATIPKPAPAAGKTAVVTENLRLRSDFDMTAEVVATLAAGTRVKILLLGREDTIDGIKSNWVQVRVLGGAKDKDGNTVAAETKGWLFGGYLSEMEAAAESESPNKNADEKQNTVPPILPIAAGVAALAILLAVVLLAVKKRKSDKD